MKAPSSTLKNAASGVLGPLSCSRTFTYAARANGPAALLDDIFERVACKEVGSVTWIEIKKKGGARYAD
ncbi:MAG: hypothetical protein F4201_09675 [Nitrospira sp. SB0677_bin_15]|nr:hypothetical protein [Nitrospira sp. SB0661_bin_20]MYG41061.1 hypothetical protein [Nitrospira sp. SB0677_bin_15]MYJ23179.1 hypothetical protein [Nitrospira sp. SB0673_bin_12]